MSPLGQFPPRLDDADWRPDQLLNRFEQTSHVRVDFVKQVAQIGESRGCSDARNPDGAVIIIYGPVGGLDGNGKEENPPVPVRPTQCGGNRG